MLRLTSTVVTSVVQHVLFFLICPLNFPVTFVVNLFKRPANYFRLTPSVDRLTDMILKL